jgi:hypothetical protein
MMILRRFSSKIADIPLATSWYLSDLGEFRGKQELFKKQSPQKQRQNYLSRPRPRRQLEEKG